MRTVSILYTHIIVITTMVWQANTGDLCYPSDADGNSSLISATGKTTCSSVAIPTNSLNCLYAK